MKSSLRVLALAAVVAVSPWTVFAAGNPMGDIVKAQVLIGRVMQVVDQYREMTIQLEAPDPIADNSGKYLLPYRADGEVTEWADKALNAQMGKVVGEKAGSVASNAVASKIPFGGFAAGFAKKKVKETAGVIALGGMDYIKETSELSVNDLNSYAVYLHVLHAGDSNYKEVVAAAIAVYPDLEGRFEGAIKDAYRRQAAAAK